MHSREAHPIIAKFRKEIGGAREIDVDLNPREIYQHPQLGIVSGQTLIDLIKWAESEDQSKDQMHG